MDAEQSREYGLVDEVVQPADAGRIDANTLRIDTALASAAETYQGLGCRRNHYRQRRRGFMANDSTTGDSEKLLYCSFCGKEPERSAKAYCGAVRFICDECVDLCNDIIREEVQEAAAEPPASSCRFPREIKAF